MSSTEKKTKKNKFHGRRLGFPGIKDSAKLQKFIDQLPKRTDFVDKKDVKVISDRINDGKDIMFLPNDILEQHYHDGKRLVFKLLLMGILRSGEKAAVVLNGIEPFIELRVPRNTTSEKFKQGVKKAFEEDEIWFSKIEIKKKWQFLGFTEAPDPHLIIYFRTLHARKKAIVYLYGNNIEYINKTGDIDYLDVEETHSTAHDDKTCYYRVVSRDYKFKLAGWNILKKYRVLHDNDYVKKECYSYTFEVDVNDIKDAGDADSLPPAIQESVKKDKTMVMCFDLETDDLKPTGNAPSKNDVFVDETKGDLNPRAIIEMDCCTFHWQYSTDNLLTVSISAMASPMRSDTLLIQVKDQMQIIQVKSLLVECMAPEFITGFNDGDYDWPFINRRVEKYDDKKKTKYLSFMKKHMSTIPYTLSNAKYTIVGPKVERNIKISADIYVDDEFFEVPGFICIDTRTIFRQKNPNAGSSGLNFFLAKNKLGSKVEMSYITMFRVFRVMRKLVQKFGTKDFMKLEKEMHNIQIKYGDSHYPLLPEGITPETIHKMDLGPYDIRQLNIAELLELLKQATDIIHYCNIDAKRCQELLKIRNIIPDTREVVNLSYTSMFDGFYRAGGMKVRNMVMAYAIEKEWNIAISNINTREKDPRKYPGAFVVPPKKGLYREHKIVKRRRRQLKNTSGAMTQRAINSSGANAPVIGFVNEIDIDEVTPDNPKFLHELLMTELHEHIDYQKSIHKVSNDENDQNDRPSTGLDFSSLYPSLIMTYNLSPEKIVRSAKYAKYLQKKGYDLHPISFEYKGIGAEHIEGWSVRHRPKKIIDEETGKIVDWVYKDMGIYPYILKYLFDMRSQMKKKLHYYGVPKEYMEQVMAEPEYADVQGNVESEREMIYAHLDAEIVKKAKIAEDHIGTFQEGYYAYQLKSIKSVKDFLNKEWRSDDPESIPTFAEFYADVVWNWNYYDSKQKALKVFMNTFYGETGNSISPFFMVEVAGGITSAGQDNIKLVKKFVEEKEYNVIYGDTDSLYLSCPESVFTEVDEHYLTGKINKLQYWTRMVELTMLDLDKVKAEVNQMLMDDNGTPFLKMAYEEVLWPVAYLGKKKYIGVKHEGIVNLSICLPTCTLEEFMKSRSLFIRGLEIIKRGASEFLCITNYEVFQKAFGINTTMTLKEIVDNALEKIPTRQWDIELFKKTARYKLPGKKDDGSTKQGNVTVLRFVDRMKQIQREWPETGIQPPILGERYTYIVCRKYPWSYGLRGTQSEIKAGDKQEYFESLSNKAYEDRLGEKLEIDMDYYVENEVIGQFARFLTYHTDYDQFYKISEGGDEDEAYKAADEKAVNFAKKTLIKYYRDNFATKYEKRGKTFQSIFKSTNKAVSEYNHKKYGDAANLFDITTNIVTGGEIDEEIFGSQQFKHTLRDRIMKEADKVAAKGVKKRIEERLKAITNMRKKGAISVYNLYQAYVTMPNSICKVNRSRLKEKLSKALVVLSDMLDQYQQICFENTKILEALVYAVRTDNADKIEGRKDKEPDIDYAIVEKGLQYLERKNKVVLNPQDIKEFMMAVEGDDFEESEEEEESEEDEAQENAEEERATFMYDLFDNFAEIAAIKRALLELDLIEKRLLIMKNKKVGLIEKPVEIKRQPKKTVDAFNEWNKKQNNKKEFGIPTNLMERLTDHL